MFRFRCVFVYLCIEKAKYNTLTWKRPNINLNDISKKMIFGIIILFTIGIVSFFVISIVKDELAIKDIPRWEWQEDDNSICVTKKPKTELRSEDYLYVRFWIGKDGKQYGNLSWGKNSRNLYSKEIAEQSARLRKEK